VLEPDEGKLSSPVPRGLAPSNGGGLLGEAHSRLRAFGDDVWRAFDKTVRRKPLPFAVDAVYGNSIELDLEVIARKGVARKPL
jgi:hypothetical protein